MTFSVLAGAGLALAATVLAAPASAADEVGVANFRLPPQLSLQLSERWNARLDGESRFSDWGSFSDSPLTLPQRPAAAFLDWRPAGGGFRISGGYFAGAPETDPAFAGTAGYDFMRLNSYGSPLSLAGTGAASASYLGIGWDGDTDPTGGWGFKLDLGMMFTATRGPDGTAELNPAEAIAPRFQSTPELDPYRGFDGDGQYPVLSIGARYRW
jgi:hypothetical protein